MEELTEAEKEQKRDELISDAKDAKHKLEAQHSEMLDAVTAGDSGMTVPDHETVQVGEVDVTVKSFMPGEALNTIKTAQKLAKRESIEATVESISTMCDGMSAVTVRLEHAESGTHFDDSENIRKFWRGMFDRWGIEGFQHAAEQVLEPATEDMEDKSNAAKSFQRNK